MNSYKILKKDAKGFNNIEDPIQCKLLSYKEKYYYSLLITNIVDELINFGNEKEIKNFIDNVLFCDVDNMEINNFLYKNTPKDKYYEEFKKEANNIYLLEVKKGYENEYNKILYYDIFKNQWYLNDEVIGDLEKVNNLLECYESYKMKVAFKVIINNIDEYLNDN